MMTKPLYKGCDGAFAFPIPLFFPFFKKLKKNLASPFLLATLLVLAGFNKANAQTTEFFEGATAGSKTLTNAPTAIKFTLTNQLAVQNFQNFGVHASSTPSATTGSNFYIGNDGNGAANQINSIKSTDKTPFTVKSMWIYPSSILAGDLPTNDGTITFTGKKNGAVVFTFMKSGIFQSSVNLGTNYNGFAKVSFSSGTDNMLIDELVISLDNTYKYIAIDNFEFSATPTVISTAATAVTSATATLNALVNPSASAVSGISFDYSTSPTLATGVANVTASPLTLASGNSASAVSANLTSLIGGTTYYYRAKATNGVGTNDNANILSFTTTAVTPAITGNPPNRTICVGNNTTFPVTATNATAYQWQVDDGGGFVDITNGAPYSGATTGTLTITGATAGMSGYRYRARAINGSNSVNSSPGTLNVVSIVLGGSQSDVTTPGGNNGSATVTASGGIIPYTYSWSPSGGTAATATGLTAGAYTVTVSDGISCAVTKTFTISEPPPALNASFAMQTNVACNGSATGSATVAVTGGTGPYTYYWLPSGGSAATATGLAAGTYTVTVRDANNATDTQSFTITEPDAFSVTPSQTDVSCNGGTNGSADVTVTGGTGTYTYSWFPSGGTAASATGLAAGTYTVTIKDSNNCQTTHTFTINQPTALNATASAQTDVSCNGGINGSATVGVTGGTPGYTYSWAPSGGTAAKASGLAAGAYTVTVVDANGCTTTQSFTINQPAALNVTTSQTDLSCNGGANGSADVTVSGGSGSYTYSWSPSGGNAAAATGLTAGTYTVTITDAVSLCQTTQTFTINEPAAFAVTTSQIDVSCNGGTNGSAGVTVSGGTGAYTYSWSPSGGNAATATGLAAGTYTVTITDANLCQTTRTFTINQPSALNVTRSSTPPTTFGGTNGTATVNVTGGTPGYTYSWLPTGGTGATATGLSARTYTVTIIDANGCSTITTVTVANPTTVTAVSSTSPDGNYGAGATIPITVTFTEPVIVTGTPALALNTGGTATYTSGSGTNTLTFNYTVGAVQMADLDYSSTSSLSLAIAGGTIKNTAGFNADLTLASPGSAGSLGANKNIAIDGIRPTVVSITRADNSPTHAQSVTYTLTFSKAVTGVNTSDFILTTSGVITASVASISGSGSTYTVTISPVIGTGTLRMDLKSSGTGIQDSFSNAINGGFTSGQVYDVDQTPVISTTGTLSALNTTYGTASANTSFSVSAVNLTTPVSISAPSGFELSSNSGSGFANSITVGATGALASTTIYVRLKADAKPVSGPYSGNISLSTSGGTTVTVATVSSSVALKPITLTISGGATNKIYDGSVNVNIPTSDYTLSGVVTGDVVSVTGIATYADANVGANKTITVNTFTLTGTDAANYSLTTTSVTTSGTITPRSITLSLNASPLITKIYDGSSTAALAPANYVLNGIIGTDMVTASGAASYADKNAGTGKTVTVNNLALNGPDAPNYSLSTSSTTTTGNITQKSITLALNASPTITKVYNGTSTAVLAPANYILSGVLGSDVVNVSGTASYANANMGVGKIITVSSLVLAGTDAANYNLTTNAATTTGNITQKSITLALNASPLLTKVYDGSTTAALAPANYNLTGVVSGDAVTVSGTASYADKNVGVGKTITVGNLVLAGTDVANYMLTTSSATTTGNITQKSLTLALNASPLITKVYDGLNTATLVPANYTLSGVLGTDVVTVSGTANYANANIGVGKTITVGTFVLAGANASNYNLSTSSATTTGTITPQSLTLTLNTSPLITKTYDGTSTAVLAPANYNLTGVVSGDVVTVSGTANYDNRLKGNGKAITASNFVLAGIDAPNYNLTTLTASTTGNITGKTIALVFNNSPAITKVYDGTTAITLSPNNYSLSGVNPGDEVTVNFTANYVNKNAAPQVSILASTASLSGTNADNYTLNLNLAGATGAITPKPMSIIADAKSKAIGTADPVFTYTANGLIGTDALTGELTRAPGETAGNYAITQGTLSAGTNYTSTFTPATLTIGGQLVTVTAVAKTKTYGDADPVLTYTVTGLAAGDALTGNLSRSIGENVGSYGINVGSLSGGSKYSINFVGAALTINKAVLTITASNKQICLGASLPAFDVSYAGFKNADNANSLSTKPVVNTTATANSPAGNYTLIPSGGVSDNYSFVYVNGQLSINTLLVAAISSSAGTTLAKGQATVLQAAVLTASVGTTYTWANADGIISGQNTANLTVSPTVTTTYTVTVSNGGCTATASITLTVNQAAELVIEATNIMTPNGDGINDKWIIKDIELYPNNTVTVFDRGGRIVFSQKGYKNSWDATLRGTPLAEGTYYFVIDLGDGKTIKKGFITIIHK